MATAKEQREMLEKELARVRADIEKLKVEEALLVKMIAKMDGNTKAGKTTRTRSPAVKPVVLDIMRSVGAFGATTAEVDDQVREVVPTVAKDTVGSVLSRLKADGALVYVNERYYEKQHAPKDEDRTFNDGIRAVK
ncbi:MAG: hypothetical protein KDK10_01575 [Maritimibacter sp.]|nr:hypothetical protein [Maritimibacter sp.]